MKYTQTKEDLHAQFADQTKFIQRSIQYYDDGDHSEAKRIAVSLRILFNETRNSRSLLSLLGLENKLLLWSSGGLYTPSNLLSSWTLLSMSISGAKQIFQPLLDDNLGSTFYLDFDDWWNEVIFDDKNSQLTRRDIVRIVANQDGGAHVDPEFKEEYSNLVRNNSLGFFMDYNGEVFEPVNNPAYAAIRQIAHELLVSLTLIDSQFIRRSYVERFFEMRYEDESRRFKWSSTDIDASEETLEIINNYKAETRNYFVDSFEKSKREVITSNYD